LQWGDSMEIFLKKVQPQQTGSQRTIKIKMRLVVKDCTGTLKVTDLMLQGGPVATPWVGHPSEIKWSFDNG